MIDKNQTVPSEIESLAEAQAPEPRTPGLPLFTFGGNEPAWLTVNDTVMGGVSSSAVSVDVEARKLKFSGRVSLENNGGFASTRSDYANYDLRGYDGILMRVLGDGSTYRLRIRTAKTGPEIAYTALFETKAGSWHEVYIPFASMVPTYRGFVVESAGELDPASIRSFGLMVSDKQEGEFTLEVDWINAVAVKRNEYSVVNFEAADFPAPSLVYAQG